MNTTPIRTSFKKAFIGRFLDETYTAKKIMKSNSEASLWLVKQSLSDLKKTPITTSSPRNDMSIAKIMAAETISAINRSGGKNSMHWYTDSIKKMIEIVSSIHPEISNDETARNISTCSFKSHKDARTVLFCAIAITSQNIPVRDNMRYAMEQYRYFVKNGKFNPILYGVRGPSIKNNLERFNILLEVFNNDIESLADFLATPFPMKILRDVALKHGITIGESELLDETVYGSMVFGPKIGNGFYQNLIGNFSTVTIDMWFMRTWGRYTGTLIQDSVSPSQINRLTNALIDLPDDFKLIFSKNDIDVNSIGQMERSDLSHACKTMSLIWEHYRRKLIKNGFTNSQALSVKKEMKWPHAAESIHKSISKTVDAPKSASTRQWIRKVVNLSLKILDSHGYNLTSADLQALLWYPEKDLYDTLCGRNLTYYNVSYDEALMRILAKESQNHELEKIDEPTNSI